MTRALRPSRAAALGALARLQAELEAIYGVWSPARVENFVVDSEQRRELRKGAGVNFAAPEELLVQQEGEDVNIALYLREDLLAELAAGHDWVGTSLGVLATVIEGVSHFVYLTWRAAADGRVSQLELEAQAEVDKFAACLFALWRRGRRDEAPLLWERMFERVSFREGMPRAEHERYRLANTLAGAYCKLLASRKDSAETVMRELRRVYRLAASEKLAALRSPLPA